MKLYTILFLLSFSSTKILSQNNRLNTHENIGWYNYFGTFKVAKKYSIHTEYQFRRANTITDWQQSLLRLGVNYHVNPRVLFRLGYAWIETFSYGEIPLNGLGRDFTEHRIFQMMQLSSKEGRFDFSHRFMLEQRFVGRYSSTLMEREDEFPLLHRARYMLRVQTPLLGKEFKNKTPYLAVYDEIFIGFGENVNANVFDQNRLGLLLGMNWDKNLRFEAGYLNQILQFGRQINNQNVFQNNHGLIVNLNINCDLTK
jgi:hypothetical protein